MGLKADWLRGWRTIPAEGKREYAFLVSIALGIGAVCLYIVWFAYLVPFWRVVTQTN